MVIGQGVVLLQRIPEVGGPVPHLPELLRRVPSSNAFERPPTVSAITQVGFCLAIPLGVNALVHKYNSGYCDEPDANEHQLNAIYDFSISMRQQKTRTTYGQQDI